MKAVASRGRKRRGRARLFFREVARDKVVRSEA